MILLPPPLVPEPATLHFSHLSNFFVLVVSWPASFQPKHLLPTSPSWPQITFCCRLVQQWRRANFAAQCPKHRSSLQRWEGAQEKSCSALAAPGRSVLTQSVGMASHANTDEPKASVTKDVASVQPKKKKRTKI